MHMHCRDCGLLCAGEHESLCAFCRTRNRFWFILDELPVSLRGWAINSLRIWTSIQREINIKNTSAYKKKRARQLPLRRKARLQQFLLVRGERSQQKAKSAQTRRGWSLSVRRTRQKSNQEGGKSSRGGRRGQAYQFLEGPSSRPRSAARRRSRTRSRDETIKKRASKTRSSIRRRRRRSSRDEAASEPLCREAEPAPTDLRARPSVRPSRTPSRSPSGRNNPPARTPPIIRPAVKRTEGHLRGSYSQGSLVRTRVQRSVKGIITGLKETIFESYSRRCHLGAGQLLWKEHLLHGEGH